jgi:hypothetical protein
MMGGSLFQQQRQEAVGADGDDANEEAVGGDGERNDGRIIQQRQEAVEADRDFSDDR